MADIIKSFKQAWEAKDIDALIGLLDPDATAIADGGGLVNAELRPIEGGQQVARVFVDVASKAPDLSLLERTVNGQPGLVVQQDGVTVGVVAFDVAGDRSGASGQYGTPRSSSPGPRADARLPSIGSAATRGLAREARGTSQERTRLDVRMGDPHAAQGAGTTQRRRVDP